MATRTSAHAELLQGAVRELLDVVELFPKQDLADLIPLFPQPGYTTPAEWRLLLAGIKAMTDTVVGLNEFAAGTVGGAREIAESAGIG